MTSFKLNEKIYLLILVFFIPTSFLNAQFKLNGAAFQTSERCWTLTPQEFSKVGTIWNEKKVNLNESFTVSLDVYLGCKDGDGADGIVFGFQPVSTSFGSVGEGIGFQGVSPSIGIELDTWQNFNRNDPVYDHIALIKNGSVDHSGGNTLVGPLPFPGQKNIEDCTFHDLEVRWDADKKLLQAFWDCEKMFDYTGDIVNEIFKGDPSVYWGFTSATGGANNEHKICLKYSSFLDRLPDTTICQDGQVKLKASGGVTYKWTPEEGLNNPNIAEPVARPKTTTRYQVTVKDKCGRSFSDTLTVKVGGQPINVFLGNDTTLCENQTLLLDSKVNDARYRWQDGSAQRAFTVSKAGQYAVAVEKFACYSYDTINVRYIRTPSVDLGNDTTLCEKQRITLKVNSKDARVKWQNGTRYDSLLVTYAGIYSVTLSNQCAEVSDAINVQYTDCHKVYIPNVFSPNGDEKNELFMIYDGGDVIEIKSLQIFDRWGSLVFNATNFKPNDKQFGWDGGDRKTPDVYTYFAVILFKDDIIEVKKGDVTLMR